MWPKWPCQRGCMVCGMWRERGGRANYRLLAGRSASSSFSLHLLWKLLRATRPDEEKGGPPPLPSVQRDSPSKSGKLVSMPFVSLFFFLSEAELCLLAWVCLGVSSIPLLAGMVEIDASFSWVVCPAALPTCLVEADCSFLNCGMDCMNYLNSVRYLLLGRVQ